LQLLCQLDVKAPARILEIGGGQLALLCKSLFNDDCTVADISEKYVGPIRKAEVKFVTYSLLEPQPNPALGGFDIVILLEVIEHIPLPGHVVIDRIKTFLKPGGILFLTTRNLFRLRNLARMILGREFLDHFTLPSHEGHGLGHQLEYSAKHLQWQIQRAGLDILMVREDNLGARGHSPAARLARTLVAPLELRPVWRDGLVAVARRTG
jgi:2-polyprenyl-3-methyl-5-hydroxy-6-metoxy-1,4-benzoquinol methylase